MAERRRTKTDLWRFVAAFVSALGAWWLLDIAAGRVVRAAAQQRAALAATGGLHLVLVMVLGLLAVGFFVVLARVAGRRPAFLLATVLLGIYGLLAVAWLAWRLGSPSFSFGESLSLTRYAGEAAALAIALFIIRRMPGLPNGYGPF